MKSDFVQNFAQTSPHNEIESFSDGPVAIPKTLNLAKAKHQLRAFAREAGIPPMEE